jgi:hypothetical protein
MAKKKKRTKGQTTINKTLHRKLKIEQQESHQEQRVNACAPQKKEFHYQSFVFVRWRHKSRACS